MNIQEHYLKYEQDEDQIIKTLQDYRLDPEDKDGRLEIHNLKDDIEQDFTLANTIRKRLLDYIQKVEENMDNVVMIVPASSIYENNGSEHVIVLSKPLYRRRVSDEYYICKNIPYAYQPSAFCYGTGFFVQPIKKGTDQLIVATAAHVILGPRININDIRFIRGIQIGKSDMFEHQIIVHKSQIYAPKSDTLNYELSSDGPDWALMDVVPAYDNITPTTKPTGIIVQTTPLNPNDKLYAIGHGLGLPLKVSFDGEVLDPSLSSSSVVPHPSFYETKLTLLGGNSGSPIFCMKSHKLIGLYMRGVKKLTMSKNNRCLIVKNEKSLFEGQECLRVDNTTDFYKAL